MQFRVFILLCLFHLVPSCSVYAIGNQSKPNLTDTAQIDHWLQLSNQALQKNFKLAKSYADSALSLAESKKHESRIFKAHEYIANAEMAAGNFKESFEHFNLSYEHYMSSKQQSKAAHMLNRMGECKRLMDDYQTALNYFQQSIKIQTELKDTNEVGSCQISIGVMYAVKGDKASAEKYFNDAIKTFQSINNHEREHLTLLNMGGMFREFGELEKSIEYSQKAKMYFKDQGNEKRMAIAMYNLAVAYFEKGDLNASKQEIAICLPIYEKLGDKLRINGTMMRLAEIELKQGKTDLALQYAQKALKGASEIGSLSTQVFLYKLISEIYVKKNDYKSALDYRIQFEVIRDSINSESMNEKLAELEKKYQNETQTLKLKEMSDKSKLAERDKIIANRKLKEQSNFQWFLIGFTILILLVAGLIYNRYDIKRRNNLILEEKNSIIQKSLDEKELLLNEIHHRVKNNLQFIRSMLNLQSRFVHDKQASSILLDINNRVQTMALVHQKLYQEDNLKGVEMKSFLNSLIENLLYSFKIEKNALDLQTDIDKINLDIDVANSIGLIINELLTNSIKYALPKDGKGKLEISLKQHEDNLLLKVMDAGKGFDESEINKDGGQFGIKLIHALTEKLKAEIQFYNQNGAVAEIKIPNTKV